MNQDPSDSASMGQFILDDIERELASIKSTFPANAAPPTVQPVQPAAAVKRAEPRVIDTRAINLNAGDLRRAQQTQLNRKTLQQRLAEVKVVD